MILASYSRPKNEYFAYKQQKILHKNNLTDAKNNLKRYKII